MACQIPTRNGALKDQIKLLEVSDFKHSDALKSVTKNTSEAIDSLIQIEKENST
jgi:hypothetical protein